MAEDKNSISSGLEYATKMPAMGRTEEDQQANIDAAKAGLQALEQRYANPNWFNVAAGFLKPQLGGFAASLGSAAEALGANTEQQRANQIPIYNARAQLGYMQAQQANKQKAAQLFQGLGDKPMDVKTYRDIEALAPGSEIAVAAKAAYEGLQKDRTLAASEQGNAMQRVQYARQNKLPVNPADLELISAGSPTKPQQGQPAAAAAEAPPTYNFNGKPYESAQAFMEDIPNMSAKDQKEAINMLSVSAVGKPVGAKSRQQGFEDLGLNPDQAREQTAANLKANEEAIHPAIKEINTYTPQHVSDTMDNVITPLSELLAKPGVRKGLGIMFGDAGVQNAVLNALNSGTQIVFGNTHLGGSVGLESIIKNVNIPKEDREDLRNVQILLGKLQSNQIRQASADVGGKLAVPEFQNAISSMVSTSDPANILQKLVGKEAITYERNGKIFEHYHGSYLDNPANRNAPGAKYLFDPGYKAILKEYSPQFARVNKIGQKPVVATPPPAAKP